MIFEKANGAEFIKLHSASEFRVQTGSGVRKDFTLDPVMVASSTETPPDNTVFTVGVERTSGDEIRFYPSDPTTGALTDTAAQSLR